MKGVTGQWKGSEEVEEETGHNDGNDNYDADDLKITNVPPTKSMQHLTLNQTTLS